MFTTMLFAWGILAAIGRPFGYFNHPWRHSWSTAMLVCLSIICSVALLLALGSDFRPIPHYLWIGTVLALVFYLFPQLGAASYHRIHPEKEPDGSKSIER
jgi:hypothetical protein